MPAEDFTIPSSLRQTLTNWLQRAWEDITRVSLLALRGRGTPTEDTLYVWENDVLDEVDGPDGLLLELIEDHVRNTGKYKLCYWTAGEHSGNAKAGKRFTVTKGRESVQTRTRSGGDKAAETIAASFVTAFDQQTSLNKEAMANNTAMFDKFLTSMQEQHEKEIQGSSELLEDLGKAEADMWETRLEMVRLESGRGLFSSMSEDSQLVLMQQIAPAAGMAAGELIGLIRDVRLMVQAKALSTGAVEQRGRRIHPAPGRPIHPPPPETAGNETSSDESA